MKFDINRLLFLINDITNVLLSKEKSELRNTIGQKNKIIFILGALLVLSVFLNIFLLIAM